MNTTKAQQTIMDKINDGSSLFSQGYYILYFISQLDGELYVYDTREPHRALRDIQVKHQSLEFLRIESYPNEPTVRDITRVFRLAREARLKLIPTAETVAVLLKATAGATAPQSAPANT